MISLMSSIILIICLHYVVNINVVHSDEINIGNSHRQFQFHPYDGYILNFIRGWGG